MPLTGLAANFLRKIAERRRIPGGAAAFIRDMPVVHNRTRQDCQKLICMLYNTHRLQASAIDPGTELVE